MGGEEGLALERDAGAALAGSFLNKLPVRMIGDKAYDSDPLDAQLQHDYGIEQIAPNRSWRGRTQDGMAAYSIAIAVAVWSSVYLLVCATTADSSLAGSTMSKISSAWFILAASKSFRGIYEMGCRMARRYSRLCVVWL